jgi:hypothetical protein
MVRHTVTLQQLYRKVRRDRKFFDALIKSPRAALKQRGLMLTDKDLHTLESLLRRVYKVSAKDIGGILADGRLTLRPWPAFRPWPALNKPGTVLDPFNKRR